MTTPPHTTRELEAPLGRERIRRIYDRIGRRYDLLRFAEAEPKRVALARLALRPGERALEVGAGTGAVLVELARAVIAGEVAEGEYPVCGLDLSSGMLAVARERLTAAGLADAVELREGDATALPYPDAAFDVVFSSYVLDLLSSADVDRALAEMRRVLRPRVGRLALVTLSPGDGGARARLFTRLYESLYRVRPNWLAGCRPIQLAPRLQAAGFTLTAQRMVFRGHPSEVIVAQR